MVLLLVVQTVVSKVREGRCDFTVCTHMPGVERRGEFAGKVVARACPGYLPRVGALATIAQLVRTTHHSAILVLQPAWMGPTHASTVV